MPYPKLPSLQRMSELVVLYAQLKHERGAKGIEPIALKAEKAMAGAIRQMQMLPRIRPWRRVSRMI